jgi:hypothetical protein
MCRTTRYDQCVPVGTNGARQLRRLVRGIELTAEQAADYEESEAQLPLAERN